MTNSEQQRQSFIWENIPSCFIKWIPVHLYIVCLSLEQTIPRAGVKERPTSPSCEIHWKICDRISYFCGRHHIKTTFHLHLTESNSTHDLWTIISILITPKYIVFLLLSFLESGITKLRGNNFRGWYPTQKRSGRSCTIPLSVTRRHVLHHLQKNVASVFAKLSSIKLHFIICATLSNNASSMP